MKERLTRENYTVEHVAAYQQEIEEFRKTIINMANRQADGIDMPTDKEGTELMRTAARLVTIEGERLAHGFKLLMEDNLRMLSLIMKLVECKTDKDFDAMEIEALKLLASMNIDLSQDKKVEKFT